MLVLGPTALISSVGSLMLYAAIVDIGLAYTDTIVQGEKENLKRSTEGKAFLESWEKIYTVGSVATFSPIAIKAVTTYGPKMLKSGARLLQVPGKIITNPEVYKKIKDLTTKAIYSIEIPNFNKTGLEILEIGIKEFAELKNAEKLQKLGVIFVKGAEGTVAAIYKGVAIAYGKARIVYLQLRRALEKLKGKQLEEYLENRYRFLGGASKGIETKIDVDWFLASAERLASLNITAETALKYLDEALIHFNHYVKDGVVYRIGRENCASVAKVVDEYLETGKITKAEDIEMQGFDFFGKNLTDFPQLSLPSLAKVMKEGERGIIYAQKKQFISYANGQPIILAVGHYFNVIKQNGKLIYKDGQIGKDAIFDYLTYEKFRYCKTN